MSQETVMQIEISHPPKRVFSALTGIEALEGWFTEKAVHFIERDQFEFSGRYTPLGSIVCPIQNWEPGRLLSFEWPMVDSNSLISIQLKTSAHQTQLRLRHIDIPKGYPFWMEDFWFLTLENLRRYLDGRSAARFDFESITKGDIVHTLGINADPEQVFSVLTEPVHMNRWIASRAEVDLRIDGRYDYGWEESGPMKIINLIPNEKLVHSWAAWGDEPESVISWTLEAIGGKTNLTLVHSGFSPDQENSDLQLGWLNFMNWIRSISEYGPDWNPPVSKVAQDMIPYYSAAIGEAQNLFKT